MAKTTRISPTLLGPDGTALKTEILTNEHAGPTTTGVRSPWSDSIVSSLDPQKLAKLLKNADAGDNIEFLIMAEEMEERDNHYASVLGQRKRAVSGIEPIVTPASDSDEDKKIAAAVGKMVLNPSFADVVDDLLDGLAKGYSVVETVWSYGPDQWAPSKYIWRDPRFFQFDQKTGRELRIRDDDHTEGLEISPYTMMVHTPKLKSGLPVRGGLARLAAWCFMLKSYTLQDWAAFLEVFGMPLRVGKYDSNASPAEKRILLRAVRDLGADAAAIIPKGMEIQFIEAAGGQGNAVFGAMTEYLDKQMSKGIIGQTMTTDEGSSRSQSETHDEVRGDIKRADARQMATTVNRDLVAPFVGFNFGWDKPVPTVTWPVEDAEDTKAMAETLEILTRLGVRIAKADVNKRAGFRVPDSDEEILTMNVEAKPAAPQKASQLASKCAGCGETHIASISDASDDDPLLRDALSEWEADMSPVIQAIVAVAEAANSFEEYCEGLKTLNLDMGPLSDRLAMQMMKARADGLIDA